MSEETANKPAAVKRPALGRGLGALLGETRREEPLVAPASRAATSMRARWKNWPPPSPSAVSSSQ